MFWYFESDPFLNIHSYSWSILERLIYWTNVALSVWIPPWRWFEGVQRIPIRSYVDLTKLDNLGSEYPGHSTEPIFRLDPFPEDDRYILVERCRIRQLLFNLAYPSSAFNFFRDLTSSEFSPVMKIFSLKSNWVNSEVLPLALKRILLNSVTAVPMHIVFNRSHGVIFPTYNIEVSSYRYIVMSFTIMEMHLFSISSSFYAVFFPKDVPACFGFAPIPKCDVWTWRLAKFFFRWIFELLWQ